MSVLSCPIWNRKPSHCHILAGTHSTMTAGVGTRTTKSYKNNSCSFHVRVNFMTFATCLGQGRRVAIPGEHLGFYSKFTKLVAITSQKQQIACSNEMKLAQLKESN